MFSSSNYLGQGVFPTHTGLSSYPIHMNSSPMLGVPAQFAPSSSNYNGGGIQFGASWQGASVYSPVLVGPSQKAPTQPGQIAGTERITLGEINSNSEVMRSPCSPGRVTRPTSLGGLERPDASKPDFGVKCSDTSDISSESPGRRINPKIKGELVGIRVAEIEDYIQKRSFGVPEGR